jgi:hypothetical protein
MEEEHPGPTKKFVSCEIECQVLTILIEPPFIHIITSSTDELVSEI